MNMGRVNVSSSRHIFSYVSKGSVEYATETLPRILCFRNKLCQKLLRDESRWTELHGRQNRTLSKYRDMFDSDGINTPASNQSQKMTTISAMFNDTCAVTFVVISSQNLATEP